MPNTFAIHAPRSYRLAGQLSMTALAMIFATHGAAAPAGGVVVAGEARIASAAGSTVVTQSTAKAAINWLSFNTAVGESVRFIQPDSSSVRTVVWGDGSAGTSKMAAGKNGNSVLDIFGSIPEGQDPAVGNYVDNIVVTVDF